MNIEEIKKENAHFEKSTPYNYCDRWCERCPQEKRDNCTLYKEDFDANIQHIIKGEDPNDLKVVFEDVRKNFEKTASLISEWVKEKNIDLSEDDGSFEFQKKKEMELLNHPLHKLSIEYYKKAHVFLKQNFYGKTSVILETSHDFERLSWHHTLLRVKIYRALCDIYARNDKDDYSLHHAVAQIDISSKCITESQNALSNLQKLQIFSKNTINELLALLNRISISINTIEKEINH